MPCPAKSIGAQLRESGISRRTFLKYSTSLASLLALPGGMIPVFAEKLANARRLPVIWLSFQECTGCTESLTRSNAPTLENLLFNFISLEYHHTLMAAAGTAAESAREAARTSEHGRYLLIVDGSIPTLNGYSTIAGIDNLDMLRMSVEGASAVIAIGSCASFGGLPAAAPNPTAAMGVATLMKNKLIPPKSLINIPGCPPIPLVISGVLAHYLAFAHFPALDGLARPMNSYGNTVHERCPRYHFYKEQKFAERFDDEGARKGWCLYKLGCKGPTTHNACSTLKWNTGSSSPIDAGHPCLGCSEPGFWDRGGFYVSLDPPDAIRATEQKASEISDGQALYEDNCSYCHDSEPNNLHTAPKAVGELLQSGDIRSHRHLELDAEQINSLEAWLKSAMHDTGGTP
jgi:hydrogenase small subunit